MHFFHTILTVVAIIYCVRHHALCLLPYKPDSINIHTDVSRSIGRKIRHHIENAVLRAQAFRTTSTGQLPLHFALSKALGASECARNE